MRPLLLRALLAALVLSGGLAGGIEARPVPPAHKPVADKAAVVPLSIATAHGRRRFRVELARTPAEQERGLMFRTVVPKGTGMLFPMAPSRPTSFWMKNTLVPLDMLFIRPDGTIARIAANTTPQSLELVRSGEPVAAVLELAGGAAARERIAEGDRVQWPGGPAG